jgi:hypothetical protein
MGWLRVILVSGSCGLDVEERQWGASLITYLITSLITYILHVIRKVITYSPRFITYSYLLHVITCNKFLMHYLLHVIQKGGGAG